MVSERPIESNRSESHIECCILLLVHHTFSSAVCLVYFFPYSFSTTVHLFRLVLLLWVRSQPFLLAGKQAAVPNLFTIDEYYFTSIINFCHFYCAFLFQVRVLTAANFASILLLVVVFQVASRSVCVTLPAGATTTAHRLSFSVSSCSSSTFIHCLHFCCLLINGNALAYSNCHFSLLSRPSAFHSTFHHFSLSAKKSSRCSALDY